VYTTGMKTIAGKYEQVKNGCLALIRVLFGWYV